MGYGILITSISTVAAVAAGGASAAHSEPHGA
jgi:hypothetical protein